MDSTLDRRDLLRTRMTLLAAVPIGAALAVVTFITGHSFAPWFLLVVALLLLLAVRGRAAMGTKRPVGLRLDGGAFVAGAHPTMSWSAAAGLLVLVTFGGAFASAAWDSRSLDDALAVVVGIGYGTLAVASAVALVYVAVLASSMWSSRPAVRLTPSGVERRLFFTWVRVPYDAMGPRAPRRPRVPGSSAWVVMRIARPDLVRGRWRRSRRGRPTLIVANVDPYFLAHAITWYVDNPASRPAVGTEAELARLVERHAG